MVETKRCLPKQHGPIRQTQFQGLIVVETKRDVLFFLKHTLPNIIEIMWNHLPDLMKMHGCWNLIGFCWKLVQLESFILLANLKCYVFLFRLLGNVIRPCCWNQWTMCELWNDFHQVLFPSIRRRILQIAITSEFYVVNLFQAAWNVY